MLWSFPEGGNEPAGFVEGRKFITFTAFFILGHIVRIQLKRQIIQHDCLKR